jgi:hypothetical protein
MVKQGVLKFKLEMTKEEITSRSGLAVYSEFMRGYGLKEIIEEEMPAPGSNRGHDAWRYIEPLMVMMFGGGRKIEHLREIIQDKGLRRLTGLEVIPSISTVGDWLRRMGKGRGLCSFKKAIDKVTKKALLSDKHQEYTLWSDPTLVESEKREAVMSYEGYKGYRPIITAFKELPIIVQHEFREGNAMGGTKEAIEAAYTILPSDKKIKHASLDGEFYTAAVINYLSEKGTTFTIAADKDTAVKEGIAEINEWVPFKNRYNEKTDREIAEFVHTMNNTTRAFRAIVLRWENPQRDLFKNEKYCYHVIATDLECKAEEVVWTYNERGNMENIIKELKGGLGMEEYPTGDFEANSFWFSVGVLTYNMFILQKELLLTTEYKRCTIQTLRWMLINVAGKIVRTGRSLLLKLATTYEKYMVYGEMRRRCMELCRT